MNTLTFQLHDKDTAHVLFQSTSLFACLSSGSCFSSRTLQVFSLAVLSVGHYTGKSKIWFITWISASLVNASSEPAAEVVCPMKSGFDKAYWRRKELADPFLQISCAHGSVMLQLVVLGGTRWGARRKPHPQSPDRRVVISFVNPEKLPRYSKVSLLPKTSGLGCAKFLSPVNWSLLTSKSSANFSEMPGSRSCGLGGKLQMELHSGCTLKLAWGEENSGLSDRAYGKS